MKTAGKCCVHMQSVLILNSLCQLPLAVSNYMLAKKGIFNKQDFANEKGNLSSVRETKRERDKIFINGVQ